MKVLDLIIAAERSINAIGIDDDLDAAEANAAFNLLNGMLDEWNNQRFACYQLVEDTYTMAANKATYTIGPDATADFNGARPVEIDKMFIRDTSQPGNVVDYPIALITNDQYQSIMLKKVGSTYSYVAMYVPSFPLGTISFFPMPSAAFEFHITRWYQFSSFKSLTDTVSFPPGYQLALTYGLAELLPTLGHNPPDAVMARVERMSKKYMASIKRINAKEPIIASIDPYLIGRNIGNPNILTG
jgi:hypothetical protein